MASSRSNLRTARVEPAAEGYGTRKDIDELKITSFVGQSRAPR